MEINGAEYPINSDFRDCLRAIMAFEDNELTDYEKQILMLDNLYPQPIEDIEAAIKTGIKFLNGGEYVNEEEDEDNLRLYSFNKDAPYIFAAFRQTHGIDLENTSMHWWKFLTLFMDLGSDTAFCNLVGLRKRVKTGKASKEEREMARDLGDVFELPELDNRTLEERERAAEFLRLVKDDQ